MTDNNCVSRRDAIALAGAGAAGLALAGCSAGTGSGGPQLSAQDVSDRVSAFIAARGLDNHGDNPNEPPIPQTSPIAFSPQFMVIIHIWSDGPWSISSNHAHFSYAEQDPIRRTEHARDIMLHKLNGPKGRFRDPRNHAQYPVHNRKPPTDPQPDLVDELDFSTFQFGSQHDIYVFYEHGLKEISFDDKNNRYLTFSKFFKDGTTANRNHAFFNAKHITDAAVLGGLNGKGSLIRLENHMTYKEPMDPLATEPAKGAQYERIPKGAQYHHRYKMNLIYLAQSGMVMMIDPDTGNGVGYDP
jgi:hypothetical protein